MNIRTSRLSSKPLVAALLALTIANPRVAHPLTTQQRPPEAHKPSASQETSDQTELSRRIQVAENVRTSGDPGAIVRANSLLIASALRAMARLRFAESAPAQSAELYRESLRFEDIPAAHAELARSALLAGQSDEAISEAQHVLAADPNNLQAYITLGRAFTNKQDFVKAADAFSRAAQIQPSIETLYSLAICWLSTSTPHGRQQADIVFGQMKQMAGDSGSLHVLIGRAYRDASMMPEAIAQFKQAIALDTTTPHAHYFLGLAYLAMNDWKPTPEAQAELEKELQYHPQDYLANYIRGFIASSLRQYDVADKYLKAAVAINSQWPDPFLYLGLDAFAQNDDKAAEQYLRKAVELTGADEARANYQIRRAYVDLGRILAREGNEQESDAFVAKARNLQNKVMADTQQQATALAISEGGTATDMQAFVPLDKQQENQAAPIAKDPVDATARVDLSSMDTTRLTDDQRETAQKEEDLLRHILGQSYSDLATAEAIQHNYADALTNYQSAEKWDPQISDLDKNLGQAAFRANNYPEAVRGLSQAIKENPNSAALHAMLGMSYFELQRYGDAATAFYPLGEDGMHDPTVGYAWAASLAKAGDLKDATQVLAIYQNGQLTPDGLILVGQLWIEIGDYDRAIATLRQALVSDPSLPRVHYNIALADIRAGKWSDARTELNAELAITPDDPDTLYNLGFVDLQEAKNDDAMKLFEQVIAKHPDYANAQYQLGKMLMDGGKVQDALPHLEAAAKLSPEKDYVHYQLQAAYRRMSRTADADRELAIYQDLKAKSRAQASSYIEQQQQQKP